MLGAVLTLAVLAACAAPDTHYSQTELTALQTREYDAAFDHAFDASVAALFDAGYAVFGSDKRGGVLSGRRRGQGVQLKLDRTSEHRTTIRVSTVLGGQARVDEGLTAEVHDLIRRRLTSTPPPAPAPTPTPSERPGG
jgi:hypothetical protein